MQAPTNVHAMLAEYVELKATQPNMTQVCDRRKLSGAGARRLVGGPQASHPHQAAEYHAFCDLQTRFGSNLLEGGWGVGGGSGSGGGGGSSVCSSLRAGPRQLTSSPGRPA